MQVTNHAAIKVNTHLRRKCQRRMWSKQKGVRNVGVVHEGEKD